MILGLGTVIGSNFRPDVLAHIGSSAITVVAMFTATIIATLAGLAYLVRVRKYSFTMALLSCIPGGQAEVTAISRDFVEKDYVVALFHLVRVALVFCSTPLILAFVEGDAAVIRSNDALASMAGIADIDLNSMLLFLMISIFSLPVAILVRLPMPHLLGPLLTSSAFHFLGLVEIPRISEFVIFSTDCHWCVSWSATCLRSISCNLRCTSGMPLSTQPLSYQHMVLSPIVSLY